MRKALLFLTFVCLASLCSAQSHNDVATQKLAEFADVNHSIYDLEPILIEFKQNQNVYFSSITLNPVIVDAIVANGVTKDEKIHAHLRTYFSSSDATKRTESEVYLLENL